MEDIRTITAIVGVLSLLFGIIQYGLTKRGEFRKRFWEEQLSVYRRVCVAAASLATAKKISEVELERVEFWRLFWGELAILEHGNVKNAMEDFGAQLTKVQENEASPDSLKQLSYRLARACRKSLEETWDPVGLDDLP